MRGNQGTRPARMLQESKRMEDETTLPSLRSYNLRNEVANIHDGMISRRCQHGAAKGKHMLMLFVQRADAVCPTCSCYLSNKGSEEREERRVGKTTSPTNERATGMTTKHLRPMTTAGTAHKVCRSAICTPGVTPKSFPKRITTWIGKNTAYRS